MERPRVSTVLSSYFYYKTGCQVLFVKKYGECLGVSGIANRCTALKWPTCPGVRSLFYARSFGAQGGMKVEAHSAISLPPTLRKKPRRMGHPLENISTSGRGEVFLLDIPSYRTRPLCRSDEKLYPAVAVTGHFSKSVRSGAPGLTGFLRSGAGRPLVLHPRGRNLVVLSGIYQDN